MSINESRDLDHSTKTFPVGNDTKPKTVTPGFSTEVKIRVISLWYAVKNAFSISGSNNQNPTALNDSRVSIDKKLSLTDLFASEEGLTKKIEEEGHRNPNYRLDRAIARIKAANMIILVEQRKKLLVGAYQDLEIVRRQGCNDPRLSTVFGEFYLETGHYSKAYKFYNNPDKWNARPDKMIQCVEAIKKKPIQLWSEEDLHTILDQDKESVKKFIEENESDLLSHFKGSPQKLRLALAIPREESKWLEYIKNLPVKKWKPEHLEFVARQTPEVLRAEGFCKRAKLNEIANKFPKSPDYRLLEAHYQYVNNFYVDACLIYNQLGYHKESYKECLKEIYRVFKSGKALPQCEFALYENMEQVIKLKICDKEALSLIKADLDEFVSYKRVISYLGSPFSTKIRERVQVEAQETGGGVKRNDPLYNFYLDKSIPKDMKEEWNQALSSYYFDRDSEQLDCYEFPAEFIAVINGLWNLIKEEGYIDNENNQRLMRIICGCISEQNVSIHLSLVEIGFRKPVQGYKDILEVHQARSQISDN